jgi:hypothetical protein
VSLPVRQFPIDQAIFAEVLDAIPSNWKRVKLVASIKQTDSSGTAMDVKLDGLGQTGAATAGEPLMDQLRALFLLNDEFNTNLRGITYSYTLQPDGKWAWSADYAYA